MSTRNLMLRIFLYSILIVSSIHFINIKGMINDCCNNPFVFQNFSARAADDLFYTGDTKVLEPVGADSLVSLNKGYIKIDGISQIFFDGTINELKDFSFSKQRPSDVFGSGVGYFRFQLGAPYKEAESVVYIINNDKHFSANLKNGWFELDYPIAVNKDGNWLPINGQTQNLLIKFIDKDKNEIGIKSLVISNSEIKSESESFSGKAVRAFSNNIPAELMNVSDGAVDIYPFTVKQDGSTNYDQLRLLSDPNFPDNKYLDLYFPVEETVTTVTKLSPEEIEVLESDLADLELLIAEKDAPYLAQIEALEQELIRLKAEYNNASTDEERKEKIENLIKDVYIRKNEEDNKRMSELGGLFQQRDELINTINKGEIETIENLDIDQVSFILNNEEYSSSSGDYILNYDPVKQNVEVLFAVAKKEADGKFYPYYPSGSKNNFSLIAKPIVPDYKLEDRYLVVSFQVNGVLPPVIGDIKPLPVQYLASPMNVFDISDGNISVNSDIYFFKDGNKEQLYNNNLDLLHTFPEGGEGLKDLNPKCRYFNFSLDLKTNNPITLHYFKYISDGQEFEISELGKKGAVMIVDDQHPDKVDLYYPLVCENRATKGLDIQLQISYTILLKTDKGEESEDHKYYLNINLKPVTVCERNYQSFEIPAESFYFSDEYLDKYAQKRDSFVYYNYPLNIDMQKKYNDQRVASFSGLNNFKYFQLKFRPLKIEIEKDKFIEMKFLNIDNIKDYSENIISDSDSIYFTALNYNNKKLEPYSLDADLRLNFKDDRCSIYSSDFKIISKPVIEERYVGVTTPVIDQVKVEPKYIESYDPISGKLIREEIKEKILSEAEMIDQSSIKKKVKEMLLNSVQLEQEDIELEKKVETRYQNILTSTVSPEAKISLRNYLSYGSESTLRLGEGQRAATVINYTNFKGRSPEGEDDIENVLKIANNIIPLMRNPELEPKLVGNFHRLNNIIKDNDITKIDENNLILELNQFLRFAYGIFPMERSLARENWAIDIFVKNYNKLPQSSGDWRIVNSWAYRNTLIDQVATWQEWINLASDKYSEVNTDLLDEFFNLLQ